MKPEHEERRKIIREWISLPKDERQTEEQAKTFAKKNDGTNPIQRRSVSAVLKWLLLRIDKSKS